MSRQKIEKAFILGAGLGRRMLPLTENSPKPMVEIEGRSLICHALDRLKGQGVRDVVINTHYKADVLHDHLKDWRDPPISWSHEEALLDTGGGIKKKISTFGEDDFFVIAGDSFWIDGPQKSALQRLEDHWDPDVMDILILLQPVETMHLTKGIGDYHFVQPGSQCGAIERSMEQNGTHMFTSLRINAPQIFEDTPDGAFSYLDLLDKAQEQGRLYGLVHDGVWHHISTPGDLERVNEAQLSEVPQALPVSR